MDRKGSTDGYGDGKWEKWAGYGMDSGLLRKPAMSGVIGQYPGPAKGNLAYGRHRFGYDIFTDGHRVRRWNTLRRRPQPDCKDSMTERQIRRHSGLFGKPAVYC